jgi:pyroglutamyl-peptidase
VVPIILVTGFKQYSNFKRNPSGEIAELLDGSYFRGKEVVGMALEAKHSVLEKEYLREVKKGYEVIVNTGLSPGRRVIGVEKVAVNWQSDEKDEDGVSSKAGSILREGPDGLFSRLPVEDILHSLRSAKIPSEISFSAGIFLSNKIFFLSLYYSKGKAGFVNFPAEAESSLDGKYPTMNIESMIKSLEITIQKTI